jgi:hypothetical protein
MNGHKNAPSAGTSTRKIGSHLSALLIYALCLALWSTPSLAETAFANASSRVTWSPTDMYQVGAIVNYAAANYISLTKNVGITPVSSSTDWAILDSAPKRSARDTSVSAETRGPVGAAIAGSTTAPRVTYAGPYVAARRYSANDVVTEGGTSYIAVTNVQHQDPANDVRFSAGNWAVFSTENPRWTLSATGTAATPQPNGPKNFSTPKGFQRPAEPTAVEPKHNLQAQDAFLGCNDLAQQLDPFYQRRYLGADCGTVRTRTDYGVVGSMLILSLFPVTVP